MIWTVSTFKTKPFIAASCHAVVFGFVRLRRGSSILVALREILCHFRTLPPFVCSHDFLSLWSSSPASQCHSHCGQLPLRVLFLSCYARGCLRSELKFFHQFTNHCVRNTFRKKTQWLQFCIFSFVTSLSFAFLLRNDAYKITASCLSCTYPSIHLFMALTRVPCLSCTDPSIPVMETGTHVLDSLARTAKVVSCGHVHRADACASDPQLSSYRRLFQRSENREKLAHMFRLRGNVSRATPEKLAFMLDSLVRVSQQQR